MLTYAATRRVIGKRESSPNALLLIISVHVALLAALMSSKMDVTKIIHRDPPLIKVPIAPAPPPPTGTARAHQQPQHITQVEQRTAIPKTSDLPPIDSATDDNPPQVALTGGSGMPLIPQPPVATPIRQGPQLLTPPSELKPPYPPSKLAAEQEGTLRLALTIDASGRVTAVEPVGYADREFLEAARRYIIAHWRYQPATEDGHTVSSTLTVTLDFQLQG